MSSSTNAFVRRSGAKPRPGAVANPLRAREPRLVEQLAVYRVRVNEMLLDKLAAAVLHDPAFRAGQCPYPLEDIQTAVQVLRVLTKESWDRDDFALFDACAPTAWRSALFGGEFEAERHRIRHAVGEASAQLAAAAPSLW